MFFCFFLQCWVWDRPSRVKPPIYQAHSQGVQPIRQTTGGKKTQQKQIVFAKRRSKGGPASPKSNPVFDSRAPILWTTSFVASPVGVTTFPLFCNVVMHPYSNSCGKVSEHWQWNPPTIPPPKSPQHVPLESIWSCGGPPPWNFCSWRQHLLE